MIEKQVNFILLQEELSPCYRRSIQSAEVHDAPIILWCTEGFPDVAGLNVECRELLIPDWLKGLQTKAHIFDVLAWKIGYEQGGLVIGLDTLSIRPPWHLISDEQEVVVSTDWVPDDPNIHGCGVGAHYYNNNFLARRNSPTAKILYEEAEWRVRSCPETWGYTGPCLLTDAIQRYSPKLSGAPYPSLCGWSSGYIWRFYLGEVPHPDTCVIHLCVNPYVDLYEGRFEKWAADNAAYKWCVDTRSPRNDLLIHG